MHTSRLALLVVPLLGLIFITLKLTGHVAWPWLWVLAPFWIPAALWLVVFLVALLVYAVTPTGPWH